LGTSLFNSPNEYLKQWHSQYFVRRYTTETFEAKRQLWQDKLDFLNSYDFKNKADYDLWEMHANGLSMSEIAKKLNCAKSKVFKEITRIKREALGGH